MSKSRLAVIGVGALGRHHARILAGMEDVRLVGVVDSRPEQGQQIAQQFGTQWYPDTSMLLSEVDGVVVAVPTVAHGVVADPFLRAGIPVLMEKPLADSLHEARRLHHSAVRHGATLQVGHVERFNPAFELLQQKVGRPLHIRCQRVSPYTFRSTDIGVVHDLMIHDIDLVLALTGSEIESVESFGAVTFGPHEDMAVARIRTSSGVIIDLTASRMAPKAERTVQVWCTDGFYSADLQTRVVSSWKPAPVFRHNPGLVHSIIGATPNPLTLKDEVFAKWLQHEETTAPATDALTAELADFVGCLRTGSRPRVTSEVAVRSMEVADRVLSGLQLWSYQDAAPESSQSQAA